MIQDRFRLRRASSMGVKNLSIKIKLFFHDRKMGRPVASYWRLRRNRRFSFIFSLSCQETLNLLFSLCLSPFSRRLEGVL